MKGEDREQWRAAGAGEGSRLNLRPFKKDNEPDDYYNGEAKYGYSDEYGGAQPYDAAETATENNAGALDLDGPREETTAADADEYGQLSSDMAMGPAKAESEEPETAENSENDDINGDEAGLPFDEDEPFFAPDDDEEEDKHKKRTAGGAKRADVRRKKVLTEKEKRLRQRRRRLIKTVFLITLCAMLLTAAALTYFLLIVDIIEVYGCTRYSAEELLQNSGLKTGKHIWLERTQEAERKLEKNAYVASAVVTRVYPDKLVVNITEREEAAVLVGMNVQAVIDKDGYVLYIGARADYTGLIKISGMGSSGYHVNQRLGEESDFNSRTLVTLLEAVYSSGLEKEITGIDLGNPLSINMDTASGVIIHLGQPDRAEEKLANFKTVLPTLKSMGMANRGTLDLSAQGDPVYSPEKTPEPVEPSPSPEPNQTSEPGHTAEPSSTDEPSSTAKPENTPERTPGPTDAFSG